MSKAPTSDRVNSAIVAYLTDPTRASFPDRSSPVCGPDVHAAIVADDVAWSRAELIGYQQIEAIGDAPADLLECRNCTCGSTMSRSIGAPIVERLARARAADDIAMIARCRLALRGDAQAVASLRSALELEAAMGGVR